MAVTSRRRLTIGSLLQVCVRVVGLVSGAVVAAVQARALSRADFAVFSMVLLVSGLTAGLLDLGMSNVAVKRISQDPSARNTVASGLVIARLAGAVPLFIGSVLLIGYLVRWDANAVWFAALFLASVPIGALTAPQALFQVDLRPAAQGVLLLIQSASWLLAVLCLGAGGASLVGYGAAFLLCGVLQVVMTWRLTHLRGVVNFTAGRSLALPLFLEALPLGLGGIAVTAYYRLSGIILFAFVGAEASSDFASSFRLVDALQAIPGVLLFSFLPLMARTIREGRADLGRKIWSISYRLVLSSAIVIIGVVTSLARETAILLFGDAYASAAPLLTIVIFAFVPISMGWILTGVMIAGDQMRPYAKVAWLVAVASILCSLLLVPRYGAIASAWITVATEVAMAASLATVVYRRLSLQFSIADFVRIAFTGAVAYLVAWPFRGQSVLIGGPVAAVAGIVAAFICHLLKREDIEALFSRGSVL